MSANNQAAVAASAVLRAESPQILHNRNDSSFSSHQYSNSNAIRQPNNNQGKSSLPTSPIQGHQLSQSFPNTENFSSVSFNLCIQLKEIHNNVYSKILLKD